MGQDRPGKRRYLSQRSHQSMSGTKNASLMFQPSQVARNNDTTFTIYYYRLAFIYFLHTHTFEDTLLRQQLQAPNRRGIFANLF